MHMQNGAIDQLPGYIKEEIEFPGETAKGKRGNVAKRIQEWLFLHGHQVDVDGDFGGVTESALKDFQDAQTLPQTGVLDEATHNHLIAPMLRALSLSIDTRMKMGEAVAEIARIHLLEHPREVGGDNKGPWVRLYMEGHEGKSWFWCAGFVTFLMKQACDLLGRNPPIGGSVSCDTLAAQAKSAGLFLKEGEATPVPGSVFLVRRTSTDWTHTGLVTEARTDLFSTIEGNTNDDGNRNGYEVCARKRGYGKKDFIVFKD